MSKSLGVAVIGAGMAGRAHAAALQQPLVSRRRAVAEAS